MSFTSRNNMVHHSSAGMFAIREGDWKYIDGLGSGGFTYPVRLNPDEKGPVGQLYQLNKDPLESTNLFEAFPEKIDRMKQKLEEIKSAGSRFIPALVQEQKLPFYWPQ